MRLVLSMAVLLVALCACDDDETTDPGVTCTDYSTLTPGGSMADDVMPLFARSCALSSSCHQGDAGEGIEDLGLGPNNENSPAPDTVLQGIRDQLVSQAPLRSPLPFVEPGDPNGSWLMAKITYASTDLPVCSECSDNCGENMPQDDDNPDNGLTPGEREVIAAWILDGAENN